MPVTISPATAKDVPLVLAFVRKLAEYEKVPTTRVLPVR